ncbi:uncharacterized protein [Heptranchias perlo]|uniref:uncharacterized protein isoform X2 n=1 Tax=Heptranchias perlo TaxID=212740 RepID=UPI00355A9E4B
MDENRVCELSQKRKVALSKDRHNIYALRFSPDAKELAVGFGNGAIQLLKPDSGMLKKDVFVGHRTQEAAMCLSYHPCRHSLLFVGNADGNIRIYDMELPSDPVSITEENNEINALDFSLDGSIFATAGKDKCIRLYDSRTNQLCNMYKAPDYSSGDDQSVTSGHTSRIFALKFHPDDYHLFITGGWDRSLMVWDKRMAKGARRAINGPHICGSGIDIQGNKMVTGSWAARNSLQLWDLRNLKVEKTLPFPASEAQGEFLYAARFCCSDTVIAGGSGTGSAHVINFKTHQGRQTAVAKGWLETCSQTPSKLPCITCLEVLGGIYLNNKAVQTVDTARNGKLIAVGGVGGNLHIAELL